MPGVLHIGLKISNKNIGEKIMKHFTEKEFRCKCCGSVGSPQTAANIKALVNVVLDPTREKLGKPIVVNSGYRCQKHNLEVGGVKNSQHMVGEAADITCADVPRLKQIIVENGKFDQLIDYGTFLHVSWKRNGPNRKQKLIKK
jgi:hypothetical protein